MIYIDTDIDHIDVQAAIPLLSEQRLEKVMRLGKERDQKLSVAVYLLLKKALKELYAIDESPLFGYEAGGKPYIIGHPEIFFNLSHCRHAAACALDSQPIGVDIESGRTFKESLARHVLNDKEYEKVVSAKSPAREFMKLWTMKESLLKLSGAGLREDLKTLLPCDNVRFTTVEEDNYIYTLCQNER